MKLRFSWCCESDGSISACLQYLNLHFSNSLHAETAYLKLKVFCCGHWPFYRPTFYSVIVKWFPHMSVPKISSIPFISKLLQSTLQYHINVSLNARTWFFSQMRSTLIQSYKRALWMCNIFSTSTAPRPLQSKLLYILRINRYTCSQSYGQQAFQDHLQHQESVSRY